MPASREEKQTMLLKLYSILIVTLDVLVLLLKCSAAFLESIYQLFVTVPEKSVVGEIILITGTGHGIGRELACQFAAIGGTVVCVDINTKGNEETVQMIKNAGCKKVYPYTCDVASRDEILALVEKVTKEVGPVSVLVNNAGIMPTHPFLSHTHQEVEKLFQINVLAHFWLLEAVLPRMIKNNHGHIVALSSMAGIVGLRNLVPYCSTKFAVRGLMESLAEELREEGTAPNVHFTCIFPYLVNTGLSKNPPRLRFPGLCAMVSPNEAARQIVKAMRTNSLQVTIPPWYFIFNNILRLYPIKVGRMFKDFLEVQMTPD